MKRIFFLSAVFAALVSGAAERALLFSDDFESPEGFTDHWRTTGSFGSQATCGGGCVKFPRCGGMAYQGEMPAEFDAEMDIALFPPWSEKPNDWKNGPRWAGFDSDYGNFSIKTSGNIAMLGRVPGQKQTWGRYTAIKGYKDGGPVHLRLVRTRLGAGAQYEYYVNGEFMGSYVAPFPAKKRFADGTLAYAPLHIGGLNVNYEVRAFRLYSVPHESESANLLYNSSFEYDEDGLPTHFQYLGLFDWWNRPAEEYEGAYLKRVGVDTNEFHSGRQSLRVTLGPFLANNFNLRPCPLVTASGVGGVLTAWMKASKEGVAATLQYGVARRAVKLTREWKRYEVACSELPKPGWQSPGGILLPKPREGEATVWIDDMQVEFVDVPGAREVVRPRLPDLDDDPDAFGGLALDEKPVFGFNPTNLYATPYLPSEQDAFRFAKKAPAPREPKEPVPLAPARAALRGYRLKEGKTLVLPRFNYFMDEPEARFRVWDEKGELEETSLDISGLPFGTNDVEVAAHGRTWPAKIVKRPYRAHSTQVDNFARCLVYDGKPFIFTGLCSPVGRWNPPSGKQGFPMLDFLKAKGFLYAYVAIWGSRDQVELGRAVLERGQELGMRFDVWTGEFGENTQNPISPDEAWATLDVFTNIVANQVIDEPELGHPTEWGLEKMLAGHARHPYWAVHMNNSGIGIGNNYANHETDVFMMDNYLTNDHYGRTVNSVIASTDFMLSVKPGKPSWYFIVSDNSTLHYKNPSYGEEIAQSWGHICSGGTGISWYIGFPTTEPPWKGMVDANREIQSLVAPLTSAEICGAAGANYGRHLLRHITRKVGDDWYVFSCNVDAAPLDGAVFQMPPDAPQNGTIEVLFENRSLELKDGRFTDSYKAHTRHVYRIRARP